MNDTTIQGDEELELGFDPRTIDHLGVRLYSTLPPVIGEMISNAWDADATKVVIKLTDNHGPKTISIMDNGLGIGASGSEINKKFLVVGRNRRAEADTSTSELFHRNVLGRKGLGKLAVFGLTDELHIFTSRNERSNIFAMKYPEIKAVPIGQKYKPEHIEKNKLVPKSSHGTIVVLKNIKRKTSFKPHELATSLAKMFNIFTTPDSVCADKDRFDVSIIHNDGVPIYIDSSLGINPDSMEFSWTFPDDFHDFKYKEYGVDKKITGEIHTAPTPLAAHNVGIMLLARKKLVQNKTYLDLKANEHAHSYMTGFFNVDFIDENPEKDYISTDRKSLTWENEELDDLRNFIEGAVNYVKKRWRKLRDANRKKTIKEDFGFDYDEWIDNMDILYAPLAKKVSKSILNSDMEHAEVRDMLSNVKELFNYQSFRKFANTLSEADLLDETSLLKFFSDWQLVEATELANLAKVRLEAIEKFEYLVNEDSKEVPTIHNFIKEFPWLLDPKIVSFKDEETFSNILREHFPDKELDEKNKRIDFMCNTIDNTLYIIEIKRPSVKVGNKQISQVEEYIEFMEKMHTGTSPTSIKNIVGYIIADSSVQTKGVQRKLDSYAKTGYIYFRTYRDLIRMSKQYHQELIDKKIEIEKRMKAARRDEQAQQVATQ